MKELSILLIGVIAIFALGSYLRRHLYLDKVESRVNNKKYYVRKLPDKQEAADKIANIGIKLQIYKLYEINNDVSIYNNRIYFIYK